MVFLGTSLTAGLGLAGGKAYPALIQAKIDSAGLPFRVVNAAVNGLTTPDALRQVGTWIHAQTAVVVVELGANDILEGIAPKILRRSLQAVIDTIRKMQPAALIVIAGLQVPPHFHIHIEHAFRYQAMFEELAKHNRIALVPSLLGGILGHPQLTQLDGLHPNAKGEAIVADHVWSVLKHILPTEASRIRGGRAANHRQPGPWVPTTCSAPREMPRSRSLRVRCPSDCRRGTRDRTRG